MTRALVVILFVMLAVAGYLIVTNYEHSYKMLPGDLANNPLPTDTYGEWRRFAAEDGSFSVNLPVLPQRAENHRKDETTGEERKYDMYAAEKNDGTVFIISMITSDQDSTQPTASLLENVKDEMVAAHPDNKLVASKNGTFLGHDDMDVTIENPKALIKGKAFAVGPTLYLLMYVANKDHYDQSEYDHFISSFNLGSATAK